MNKKHAAPPVGNKYQHRYKGVLYELTVVKTENGVGYELNGKVYSSATAAAKALVGKNQAVSGPNFWHID